MKVDVLAIGAHPDDVELGCGGTIAKLISEGKTVAILDLTQGELGTRGSLETRKIEAENAKNILGIAFRENLKMKDGFLENNEENRLLIVDYIRKYQADIVFCNAIEDRHPDHAIASQLVSDACFLAGLPKIETSYKAWRPKQVYHYIQWKNVKPDFVVDISNYMETKLEVCLAYKTQFYQENSTENETPIATKNFLDSITYRCQDMGRLVGVDYAEAFTTEKTICLKNFDSIIA